MKIIFIAGDGRSGSTLLESILSNINGSISVGECHRFWVRFYEKNTLCGCADKIEECKLWKTVDEKLKIKFPNYDPTIFQEQVKEIQFYKNFKKIPAIIKTDSWLHFCKIVKTYYNLISEITGNKIIIDSSKSMSWAYLLQNLNFCDLRIIHLERNLSSVANSWKKSILLPEYYDKEVFMPKKTNYLILKSWLKIKLMGKKLNKNCNYLFVVYENLCKKQETWLNIIQDFVGESFNSNNFENKLNHAIGGNPMRSNGSKSIIIRTKIETLNNLNFFEKLCFRFINKASKKLL